MNEVTKEERFWMCLCLERFFLNDALEILWWLNRNWIEFQFSWNKSNILYLAFKLKSNSITVFKTLNENFVSIQNWFSLQKPIIGRKSMKFMEIRFVFLHFSTAVFINRMACLAMHFWNSLSEVYLCISLHIIREQCWIFRTFKQPTFENKYFPHKKWLTV